MTLQVDRPFHITVISNQFPPEVGAGAARVSEMARRWVDLGAKVTVITSMPNRPQGRIHPGYRWKLFTRESYHGVNVLRCWLYASPKHGFARTLLNNLTFAATSMIRALVTREKYDVLIASAPPFFILPAGQVAALLRRRKLVMEVRDLWPDYLQQMGVVSNPLALKGLFAWERSLLRSADHVVAVTESFARRMVEKGVAPDDVSVVTNGVDLDRYSVASRNGRERPLQVGYLGNFGAGQDVRQVVDAAALAPDARFELVGGGTEEARVREHAERAGLENVRLGDPIPRDETVRFYHDQDVVLIPLAPIPAFAETIPSKLFEVMACGRPIIASVEGEAARIIQAAECGLVVPPGDAGALAGAVQRMAETPADEREAMGQRGRAYVEERFDRVKLADQYLTSINKVLTR